MIICEVQVCAIIRGRGCDLLRENADIFFREMSKILKSLVT